MSASRDGMRLIQGGQHEALPEDHEVRKPAPGGAPVHVVDEAHNSCGSVYMRSDGIVVSLPGGQQHIAGEPLTLADVLQAQLLVKTMLANSPQPRLLIADAERVKKDTPEARRVGIVYDLAAMAFIFRNPVHRVGVAIWMRRNSFEYPVRVFSSVSSAVAWLNTYRGKE